jgi:hypothetical protein
MVLATTCVVMAPKFSIMIANEESNEIQIYLTMILEAGDGYTGQHGGCHQEGALELQGRNTYDSCGINIHQFTTNIVTPQNKTTCLEPLPRYKTIIKQDNKIQDNNKTKQ